MFWNWESQAGDGALLVLSADLIPSELESCGFVMDLT